VSPAYKTRHVYATLLTLVIIAVIIAVTTFHVVTRLNLPPTCAEDEVMARRPYPEGRLICIHIDSLTKGDTPNP
jgi:hypothetical protein